MTEAKRENTISDEALAAIIAVPERRISSLDESTFVRKWLPMFAGAWLDAKGQVPIATWVRDVSKGPSLPVNITRNGKVLYRVPPIVDEVISADLVSGRHLPLFQAMSQMDGHESRMPGTGKRFLDLYASQFHSVDETETNRRNAVWYAILVHYGFIKDPSAVVAKKEADPVEAYILDAMDDDEIEEDW